MEAVAIHRLTYEEFRTVEFEDDDTFHYELLDGQMRRKSAPSPQHQRVSRLVLRQIDNFITEKKLGEVFYAPIDVVLNDYNAPQPDLVFVSEARKSIITRDGIMGVPELVVEIMSPSSLRIDRYKKRDIYEAAGVAEYWLIDPLNEFVELYVRSPEGRYNLHQAAQAQPDPEDDSQVYVVTSTVLTGFQADVRLFF